MCERTARADKVKKAVGERMGIAAFVENGDGYDSTWARCETRKVLYVRMLGKDLDPDAIIGLSSAGIPLVMMGCFFVLEASSGKVGRDMSDESRFGGLAFFPERNPARVSFSYQLLLSDARIVISLRSTGPLRIPRRRRYALPHHRFYIPPTRRPRPHSPLPFLPHISQCDCARFFFFNRLVC